MDAEVFIGVGSNLEPARNVRRALELLRNELRIVASSTFYWSAPLERPDQGPFLNGVWRGRSGLDARALAGRLRMEGDRAPRAMLLTTRFSTVLQYSTRDAAEALERVLTNDPGTGVMRHVDAGYDEARACADERGLDLPMGSDSTP